jgi:hypothetical protein
LRALAVVVNGTRDQFLAGSRFAGNQYRGPGGRHDSNLIQDVVQCRA